MKTFTDTTGRTWTLRLTLGSAMRIKAKLDVDLLQPEAGDPPLLTRLGTDELLLGEVLCALLEEQFEAHKLSEEDVRSSFDGQTLLSAQKAFYEELIDFFRSRGRTDRAKAVAKQAAMIEAAVTGAGLRSGCSDRTWPIPVPYAPDAPSSSFLPMTRSSCAGCVGPSARSRPLEPRFEGSD